MKHLNMGERAEQLEPIAKKIFAEFVGEFPDATIDYCLEPMNVVYKTKSIQSMISVMYFSGLGRDYTDFKGTSNIMITIPWSLKIEDQALLLQRKFKKARKLLTLLTEPVDPKDGGDDTRQDEITI